MPLSDGHSQFHQHSLSFIERPHISGYMVQQRSSARKPPPRPSTAPSGLRGDAHPLLPSSPPNQGHNSAMAGRRFDMPRTMQPLIEDPIDGLVNTDDTLDHDLPSNVSGDTPADAVASHCDWAIFITAYAAGRWDPHRTPNPPMSCQQVVADSHRFPGYDFSPKPNDFEISVASMSHSDSQTNTQDMNDEVTLSATVAKSDDLPSVVHPTTLATVHASLPARVKPHLTMPLRLPHHRFRNSFSTSSTISLGSQTASSVSDVHASVATMRWAAARVDISPLALPSPEHELTDPMRGVTATIPGSHPQQADPYFDYTTTPGGTRKSRLNGFWEGTTDIDGADTFDRLETIVASPPESLRSMSNAQVPSIDVLSISTSDNSSTGFSSQLEPVVPLSLLSSVPPATAPVSSDYSRGFHSSGNADYFGDISMSLPSNSQSAGASSSNSSNSSLPHPPADQRSHSHPAPPLMRHDDSLENVHVNSVPALPRRLALTRQTSSPLPESTPQEPRHLGGRVPSENITTAKLGRAAKEERMFNELGYLAPPYPPNELERRRALYKFNIWNTGPDMNFDRIAHLAKLVFSTKGVVISLIDGNEQWFKSEWGLKTSSCARAHSFCGHAILQRGDEPMVILDSHKDWRFEKNPLVLGPPNIRFYAGAPLRTHDGYNIGTLAVIDDAPREEFSPRQRHTLKEFAAIATREMELWRDKIQLRIRDRIQNSMEQFSRECLEIDTEAHGFDHPDLLVGSSMDKVYDRAAKLVKRTLDVEGVLVMDVSHTEVLESMSAEGSVSVALHHGDPGKEMTRRQLTTEEYYRLNSFFDKFPDGRISEGIIPPSFKPFLPTHVQYALTVPIFNIDKRPFALLCAYNTHDHVKRFLEGHELSYLRAIGVIILSAVLKRRMILADKAKGLFISNISHELRTPLHGILAAAELLSESSLNHSQQSFLQTVQACGTSLVETVNHVLDFTKLSGNSKAGGVENVIVPTSVDLMQLVEEAVDGCWIGHRARTASMDDSGIGSVYSPPAEDRGSPLATRKKQVETVVDIGYRPEGWTLKCEKGGIRRVLMNLFGNSLKFTSNGFVHVLLRQLPPSEHDPPNKVKVELAVFDTGKGISQNFLKNQLFHPFSQENPLQTGTGLGLAIVSSIVTSENVGGKVDVWSEESVGTEIKVTFPAETVPSEQAPSAQEMDPFRADGLAPLPTVSLVGFSTPHKGVQLLKNTLCTYLTTWWGFQIVDEGGDIVIINDDPVPVITATRQHNTHQAYIILSASRGSPAIMSIASEHERIGGFCRILYKPGGPSRLRVILKLSIHALRMGNPRTPSPTGSKDGDSTHKYPDRSLSGTGIRSNSEENTQRIHPYIIRPPTPRAFTANPLPTTWSTPQAPGLVEVVDPDTPVPTISLGTGGTLLKSSVGSIDSASRFRVLVVEDNSILRNLLIKWLSNKGYAFSAAVDGRDGVNVFSREGPFDIVLLDLSMPKLDGVGATIEIRNIEADKAKASTSCPKPCRILALTGMSSLEDKRRAFEAGVDGYLVKPVAFKTLDDMFHKLGAS